MLLERNAYDEIIYAFFLVKYLCTGKKTLFFSDVDRGCHTPSSKSSFTPNSTNSYQSNRHNSVGSLDESHYNFRDFKV